MKGYEKVTISSNAKKRIHLVLDIVLSVFLFVTGILFAVACYKIYTAESQQLFTYETISTAFSRISVFVYITIVLVISAGVLSIFLPKDAAFAPKKRKYEKLLSGLTSRLNEEGLEPSVLGEINKERKMRRVLHTVRYIVLAVFLLVPFIFLLDPDNFPAQSYNAEILRGFISYAVFLLPLILYEVVYLILNDRSVARECELISSLVKADPSLLGKKREEKTGGLSAFLDEHEAPITLGVRIAFLGCGVLFVALGISNGGMADVLQKAINICAECIGLG